MQSQSKVIITYCRTSYTNKSAFFFVSVQDKLSSRRTETIVRIKLSNKTAATPMQISACQNRQILNNIHTLSIYNINDIHLCIIQLATVNPLCIASIYIIAKMGETAVCFDPPNGLAILNVISGGVRQCLIILSNLRLGFNIQWSLTTSARQIITQ